MRRSTSKFLLPTSALGWFRAAALAATCVTLACGESTGPQTVPGHYVLQSVAFRALPVTIVRDSAFDIAVLGGSITLDADSGFTDVRIYRVTSDGEPPTTLADTLVGTWSYGPKKVVLNPSNGVPYEMFHSGKNLTWYVEGFTHQFWK